MEGEEIVIPKELAEVMKLDKAAKSFFESLADESKKEYCEWIDSAKMPVTRQDRASKALIMLQMKRETINI